ncbi:MAG: RluA family pseudouridine synthase [Bacteroidota bacterium]|jgi:23S rRNA pseudouridine1911/1915/1917 synthase
MRNDGYTYRDRITYADAGVTLLEFYATRYAHSSAAEWSRHITDGLVERNGTVETNPDASLRADDRLAWHRPPWDEEDVPTDIPVLAESAGWMVLRKPSGIPVLPGGGFLRNTLLWIARERHGGLMSPVHRLGRGTSGAILFSRSADAARELARAMREGEIRKTYLALVQGCEMPDHFTVDAPIGPVPHAPVGMLHAASPVGKASVSHCRVLRRDPAAGQTLLEVDIPTGRPHQIRIHCAFAGHPLVGDPLYRAGGLPLDTGAVPGDCGYFLHSWQIRFPDPDSGEMMHVTAPPPETLDAGRGVCYYK